MKFKKINIVIAQNVEEFLFIKKNIKVEYLCIPVNLETLLHYEINKEKYINPIFFLDNNFHKKGINTSHIIEKSSKEKYISDANLIFRFKLLVRYYYNACFFINELLKSISNKYLLNKIIVSGWKLNNLDNPNKNYIITEIIEILYPKKVFRIKSEKKFKEIAKPFDYTIEKNYKFKNYIFYSNYGYNSYRIKNILKLNKASKEVSIIKTEIPFWKKIIFSLKNIKLIELKKKISNEISQIIVKKINCDKIEPKILKAINNRLKFFNIDLNNIRNECHTLINFFKNNPPKIFIFNLAQSLERYCTREFSHKIKSIAIPHGTISKSFNKFDKKYKKMIFQNIIQNRTDKLFLQSKIAEESLKDFKFKKNTKFLKKNIIFGNNKKNVKKNKKILYAVTIKNLSSIQYYGVEMFYEYYSNLKFLNNLAQKKNLQIVIKPHPTIHYLKDNLKNIFKNLEISTKNVSQLLNEVGVTISFSSTVIEDSINSSVPVILLDRWKRYLHCRAETNYSKKNKAIYYVSDENNLLRALNTIDNSQKINFKEYVY